MPVAQPPDLTAVGQVLQSVVALFVAPVPRRRDDDNGGALLNDDLRVVLVKVEQLPDRPFLSLHDGCLRDNFHGLSCTPIPPIVYAWMVSIGSTLYWTHYATLR